ncbi:hypothetical protein [Intrasporangium oryzae]|nr:hypothetical protein [Intrasporangium oryzae]
MDTKTLAAAIAGFLLGGLVVSTAAQLERADAPTHGAAPTAVVTDARTGR